METASNRPSPVIISLLIATLIRTVTAPDSPTDPADDLDLDIDLDTPGLSEDDFQEMMDEDDVPVGPVLRQKWRTSSEGSIVRKGRPVFALAPLPDPTPPTRVTKVQPTAGVGIGFYAPSRNLYGGKPLQTANAAATVTSTSAPPRLAPSRPPLIVVPAPPLTSPSQFPHRIPPQLPLQIPSMLPAPRPHRILQRHWHQQQLVNPYLYQYLGQQSMGYSYPGYTYPIRYNPYNPPVLSMGK